MLRRSFLMAPAALAVPGFVSGSLHAAKLQGPTWDETADAVQPVCGNVGALFSTQQLAAQLRAALAELGFVDFRMVAYKDLPRTVRGKRYITPRFSGDIADLAKKCSPAEIVSDQVQALAVELSRSLPAGSTITEPILWASREAFMLSLFMYVEAEEANNG